MCSPRCRPGMTASPSMRRQARRRPPRCRARWVSPRRHPRCSCCIPRPPWSETARRQARTRERDAPCGPVGQVACRRPHRLCAPKTHLALCRTVPTLIGASGSSASSLHRDHAMTHLTASEVAPTLRAAVDRLASSDHAPRERVRRALELVAAVDRHRDELPPELRARLDPPAVTGWPSIRFCTRWQHATWPRTWPACSS